VINSSSEKDGVADAYHYLGNRSDVKIISASLGDVFYSGQVADAVKYAYNRGKLVLAAAGTSTSWTNWYGVIFPATMSQATAITGVTDASSMNKCDNCHSGSQVEFVTVMQRAGDDDRTNLTLSQSGNDPSYVGGSSVATATTAGIAALIWAKDPSMSRSQVLQLMKENSSNYPSKDNQYGWGIINAEDAVLSAQ
jgi:subtilisin family serine protease